VAVAVVVSMLAVVVAVEVYYKALLQLLVRFTAYLLEVAARDPRREARQQAQMGPIPQSLVLE